MSTAIGQIRSSWGTDARTPGPWARRSGCASACSRASLRWHLEEGVGHVDALALLVGVADPVGDQADDEDACHHDVRRRALEPVAGLRDEGDLRGHTGDEADQAENRDRWDAGDLVVAARRGVVQRLGAIRHERGRETAEAEHVPGGEGHAQGEAVPRRRVVVADGPEDAQDEVDEVLSLIHISEPTRLGMTSYAVFCLK